MKMLSLLVALSLIGGAIADIKASSAKPATGNSFVAKSGKLQLTAPAGWYRIASDNPAFKTALQKIGAGGAASNLEAMSKQADLMVMDLAKHHPTFQRNLNVIVGGSLPNPSESILEQAFQSIQGSMKSTMLQHKLIKFSAGPTLCYWGNYKSGGSNNDLIGYVVSLKGKAFIVSFSCAKGEMEKFRPLTESIMQTVKAK